MRFPKYSLRFLALAPAVLLLAGCVTDPAYNPPPPVPPPPAAPPPPPPPPSAAASTAVYVYPANGQSEDQLDRDRYECHMWAVKQTGFDPSQPQLAPHQRVQVVATPPSGANTVAGAAVGAIVGAGVSRPRDAGAGAILGAVAGAIVGAASDASRTAQVNRVQQQYDQRDQRAQARVEQQADNYRRALGACLSGRGYVVK